MDELLNVSVHSISTENRNYFSGIRIQMLLSSGEEGGSTTSIEQPQSNEFPVTSTEWKFEICSITSMQGEGFGKTVGILIDEWSLLPRYREMPEHELVMRFPWPWKFLLKR